VANHEHLQQQLSVPLTPQQLWASVVQAQRGFLSSPSGTADAFRRLPATLPGQLADPHFKGAPVGKGYETFAGIQLLDSNGRRVDVGFGFFDGGGLDQHAEAKALRGLEKHGPASVPGGRMMVVVDQEPCPSCRERLIAFARAKGIVTIEPWVPQRDSMVQPGQTVRPKHAARSSFQADRPPTTLRQLPPIPVR
jgi:hypothetical protein